MRNSPQFTDMWQNFQLSAPGETDTVLKSLGVPLHKFNAQESPISHSPLGLDNDRNIQVTKTKRTAKVPDAVGFGTLISCILDINSIFLFLGWLP